MDTQYIYDVFIMISGNVDTKKAYLVKKMTSYFDQHNGSYQPLRFGDFRTKHFRHGSMKIYAMRKPSYA